MAVSEAELKAIVSAVVAQVKEGEEGEEGEEEEGHWVIVQL